MRLGFWLGYQRSILRFDSILVLGLAAIVRRDRCTRDLLE